MNFDHLLAQIDEAEEKFTAACEPLAFKDKARSREDLFRYQMAADYSDCWMEVKSSQGNLFGGVQQFLHLPGRRRGFPVQYAHLEQGLDANARGHLGAKAEVEVPLLRHALPP